MLSSLEQKFILAKSQQSNKPRFQVSFAALNDEELVRRIQAGEQQAFAPLLSRWQDRVYTQCYRQLGEEEIAKEATQDIFIKLYKGLGSFQFQAKFSTWLFRIVLNHCSNLRDYHYRRHRLQHESLEGHDPENPRQLAEKTERTPEASFDKHERKEIIQQCLHQLPDEQREILILRSIQEFSYQEIADILQLSLGTVKSRVHRARNALRPILEEALQ